MSIPADGAQSAARYQHVLSERLELARLSREDVDELFSMYSDPAVSAADPLIRHESIDEMGRLVDRHSARWDRDGLGTWVLRLRGGPAAGRLVGLGGCSAPTTGAWNLSFTLRPQYWGFGYAQEVATAGIAAARAVRADLPITAAVAEGNPRSRRAVERAGLRQVWTGPDRSNPDPSAVLALFSDRELSPAQIERLTA